MRQLMPIIERDLQTKMVLLTGPRQVGKTHLAQAILKKQGGSYYNWDLAEDRERILTKGFIHDRCVVLDELHKYERWKNFLKGIYDKFGQQLRILVTGSARLDIYRRGGDSLFGRHYLFHLHPLTIGEILSPQVIVRPHQSMQGEHPAASNEAFHHLMKFGGFPEPFYRANEEEHTRWSIQRREILVREEIRDLTNISLLTLIEHLLLLLPNRVGSPLSINSLRNDLQVAYNTVRLWLDALENLFVIFTLKPYTTKVARAIHKERKLYLWDWSQIKDEGARFENLIAAHLMKAVHLWRDLGFGDFELSFLRDRDRREVDFCITKDRKPWLLVEAKLSETRATDALITFASRFGVPAIQVVATDDVDKREGPICIVSAQKWLASLP